ncbi:MAG: hypothetical protein IKS49_07055 [Actinomycetaceae bacterium]|nr:hypothetical protein [Actinomycetaceae bacterium]
MRAVKVSSWGHSHGVRLAKSVLERAHISTGDELSVDVNERGEIVLTPLSRTVRSSDIDSLFENYDASYRGAELETGERVGEELI